jgi:hypothetical protein
MGWSGEHDLRVADAARVAQAAADQAAQSLQKDADHEQQTQAVAVAYGDDLNRLNTALDRMRKQPAGSGGSVPQAYLRAKGIDAAPGEQRGACEGSEFYANAMNDALTLKHWQDWAIRMQLPVE